jgi:hypothetical protein
MEVDPVSTINTQLQHREISNKYTRGLHFSKPYMRKKRQQNREMAIGSLKISRYFKPLTASVAAKPAAVNQEVVGTQQSAEVENEVEKIKNIIGLLSAEAAPVMNIMSQQQRDGTYEYSKYRAVLHYCRYRLQGDKRLEASIKAAQDTWYNKSTTYRAKMIRQYAQEYLATNRITKGGQGKHSKRFSVMDDNDIKRKTIAWFRSVARAHRNIPAVQNQLRQVILPEAIKNTTLNIQQDDNDKIINPLSLDCIRRKLIEWGFSFKLNGKYILFRIY